MNNEKRHLWEYRWFTDLAVLAAVALALWMLFVVRGIVLPVIFGLALAYAVEPLVAWAKRRLHVPRLATALLILMLGLVALTGLGLYVAPKLASQVTDLVGNVPGYIHKAQEKLHIKLSMEEVMAWVRGEAPPEGETTPDVEPTGSGDGQHGDDPATASTAPAAFPDESATTADRLNQNDGESAGASSNIESTGQTSASGAGGTGKQASSAATTSPRKALPQTLANLDWPAIGAVLGNSLGMGWGFLSSAISIGTYVVLAVTITGICYVYFSWVFPDFLGWFRQFIPVDHRQRTLEVLHKMDRAVSAWLRGRLIQVSVITVLLTAGWGSVGVPYWLVLGIVAGLANLVPYLSVIGWPAAVFLAWADTMGSGREFSFMWVIVAPSLVYIIAQTIDGWVMEPLVQGKATNLDPITVLLAVLIGGSLAGILGMLLAVPVAACGKILAQELLLPRIRAWAGTGKA